MDNNPPGHLIKSILNVHRATLDNSRNGEMSGVLLLRAASLLSALLALAAKENGIAALPVAITWDIIRLHQQQSASSNQPGASGKACSLASKYNSYSSQNVNRLMVVQSII